MVWIRKYFIEFFFKHWGRCLMTFDKADHGAHIDICIRDNTCLGESICRWLALAHTGIHPADILLGF